MTTLTFSQGIVKHSTDTGLPGGNQNFLVINGDKVDLHAPLDQALVTAFAQSDAHYLVTIQSSSDVQAWGYGTEADFNGPMCSGSPCSGGGPGSNLWYLYIEIDRISGQLSYGHSSYEPVEGSSPPNALNPSSRQDDQHWFDTTTNTMKVWRASGIGPNYGHWIEVVRLFVGKYFFGASFTSMSVNSPSFVGTTVGMTGTFRVGSNV